MPSPWIRSACALLLGLLVSRPAFAQELPSWRFQVRPYSYGGSDYSLGVYMRLSGRWDLGVQIDSGFRNTDSNEWNTDSLNDSTSVVSTTESERDDTSIGVSADVRWWHPVVDRVASFVGVQLSGGYTEYESRSHSNGFTYTGIPTESDDTSMSISRSLSLSPRFGADLLLLDRLSFLVVVRPLVVSQSWRDYDSWRTSNTSPRESHSDEDDFDVSTTFTAEAFLTVRL